VSNHPRRYYGTNELHFITCSCYHRQPWLASRQRRDLLLAVFEEVRQRYRFVVVGYVVMPDHIHLLMSEPEKGDPSRVMQAIKQGFSRRVLKSVRKRRVAAQQELFAVGPAFRVLCEGWGSLIGCPTHSPPWRTHVSVQYPAPRTFPLTSFFIPAITSL
jgi:REP element-mobilizing transposase RayT